MNSVSLLGRLVREPELKQYESGKVLATFTLAIDRPIKGADGEKKTDFIPCHIWGEPANLLSKTVHKGQRIAVYNSELETGEAYEDKEGVKRYPWWVNVGRFEYVEKKEQDAQ